MTATDELMVRPAEQADVGALVELRALMFEAMKASGVDEPGWRLSAVEWFATQLDSPTTACPGFGGTQMLNCDEPLHPGL